MERTAPSGRAQSHDRARRFVLPFCLYMAPNETIRVAIIDDNRLVREALTAMLNRLTDIRVVSSDVADSASLAGTNPDVLLLDVGLRRRRRRRLRGYR